MAINKRRDFKRLSLCIQDFLKRLPCNEKTGFLRDTLYLSLLELHKYYIKEKERISTHQTNDRKQLTSVQEYPWKETECDKYDERWKECEDGRRFLNAVEGNVQHNVLSDDHDMLGRTYLMHAIHGKCQDQTIEYILSLNFNTNHQAQDGSTALHVACQHQKTETVALLLKNRVREPLKQIVDVSIKDEKERSVLHWAAKCHSSNMIKLLLQFGADINAKDCDGMTPAMWACYFNKADNLHVVKNALERVDPRTDAILDEQDNIGRTVLHWAAMTCDSNSSMACLKELLGLCDVCKVKDNEGRTVLHTAAMQGSVSACEQILLCNKDILNVKDNQDQTALHLATMSGHGEMVDFLLQHGANNSVSNKNKRTALQEAEIGHYHYCLLVFAAFEQMKEKEDNRVPLTEKKSKDRRRYESWVIPSTSLNESHNIPTEESSEINVQQHVDVTEIKGFEINNELQDQIIANTSIPENSSFIKSELTQNSSGGTPALEPHKPSVTNNKADLTSNEVVVMNNKPALKCDQPVPTAHGRNHVTGRGNKNAFLQRSVRVDNAKDIKKQENVNHSKTTNGSPFVEDLEAHASEQHDSADESDISEISSLNLEEDDSAEMSSQDAQQSSSHKPSGEVNKPTKESLTPIKSFKHPSFNFPAKLDPISLPHQNKKPHSHGIVAPLQPPVQKEQSRLSLSSRNKVQHPSAGPNYKLRGPDHGPLAQEHCKELLSSIFKENLNKNVEQQKTPEIRQSSMQPAKLTRPTVRH